MNVVDKITQVMSAVFPDKTILYIVDYIERDKYVVHAIPTRSLERKDEYLDGFYSINRNTLTFEGGFMPLAEDPNTYFHLPDDRMLYRYE